MSISGSVTQAYRVWLDDGILRMISTSTLRDLCEEPETAIRMIRSGLVATVAAADIDTVRMAFSREVVK